MKSYWTRGKIIGIGIIVMLWVILITTTIPFINEFETFNCTKEPCESPKITIYQYIDREYLNPPDFQIPDCNIEAC